MFHGQQHYTVNLSAMNGNTVILTDDGSGTDWLVITGSYDVPTNISLQYTTDLGAATSASGTYWIDNIGSRLQVNGQIENVRGSASKDDIIGNELGNVLYGDADKTGPGGNDTISGADGDDTIFGGAGADSLSGGGQADSIQAMAVPTRFRAGRGWIRSKAGPDQTACRAGRMQAIPSLMPIPPQPSASRSPSAPPPAVAAMPRAT